MGGIESVVTKILEGDRITELEPKLINQAIAAVEGNFFKSPWACSKFASETRINPSWCGNPRAYDAYACALGAWDNSGVQTSMSASKIGQTDPSENCKRYAAGFFTGDMAKDIPNCILGTKNAEDQKQACKNLVDKFLQHKQILDKYPKLKAVANCLFLKDGQEGTKNCKKYLDSLGIVDDRIWKCAAEGDCKDTIKMLLKDILDEDLESCLMENGSDGCKRFVYKFLGDPNDFTHTLMRFEKYLYLGFLGLLFLLIIFVILHAFKKF